MIYYGCLDIQYVPVYSYAHLLCIDKEESRRGMGKLVQSCNIQLNILSWIGTLMGNAIGKIDT